MKKIMILIMALALACVVPLTPAFAGGDIDYTMVIGNTTGYTVDTSAGEVIQILAMPDSTENTSLARAWHFYDVAAVPVGGASTGFAFSVTKAVGTYFAGEIYRGFVGNKWGYETKDGIEYSTGLAVSPSAGTSINCIFQTAH